MRQVFIYALLLCSCLWTSAQTPTNSDIATNGSFYNFSLLNDKKVPDGLAYLPAPPTENDELYKNDIMMYEWGKKMRGTLRGDTAVWDGRTDIEYLMQRFGWAIGKEITPTNCPNLCKLMSGMMQDIRGGMENAKHKYARHRPYQIFNEHTPTPEWEYPDDYTSYPSGHAVRGWALAMLFVALDPGHQDVIMKTGYDYGESRVILGFHFESDIQAARLMASAGFARLCAEPSFWAYLQLAKQELENIQ